MINLIATIIGYLRGLKADFIVKLNIILYLWIKLKILGKKKTKISSSKKVL